MNYTVSMKKCSMFLILLFCAIVYVVAQDPLRVVMDDNYPPYSFRDKNGQLQGILIDQWMEWQLVTGTKVNIEGMNWSNALTEMKEGRADIIDTIFMTPSRKEFLIFTAPFADIDVPIFVHKTISEIHGLESLKGLSVAVKSGDASIDILRKVGITQIIEYDNYDTLIDEAKKLSFRVFCVDKPPALFYMRHADIDSQFSQEITLYTGQFRRAVAKGNDALLYRVQKGFSEISKDQYRKIDRRWFGSTNTAPNDYRALFIATSVALSFFFVLILFIYVLRRQVASKTKEIQFQLSRLKQSEQKNTAFIEALPDLFIIINRDGVYLDYSSSNPDLLSIPIDGQLIGKNISDILQPELAAKFMDAVTLVLNSGGVQMVEYSLDVPAGHRSFECRVVALDTDTALYITRDVTDRILYEKALIKSIEEKDVLLHEVHHRVKNNLQVISSIIALQADLFQNEEDKILMQETQHRIQAMAQLHNMLYRSDSILLININEYVENLLDELVVAYHTVSARVEILKSIDDFALSIDVAMPLGLIVTELVSNSFRYAFPGDRHGKLSVSLTVLQDTVTLVINDDGIGMPPDFSIQKASSLGYVLVRSLSRQIGGSLQLLQGSGTNIKLSFEIKHDQTDA